MPVTVTVTDEVNPRGISAPKVMVGTTGHKILISEDGDITTLEHPTDPTEIGKPNPNLALSSYVDFVGGITIENAE